MKLMELSNLENTQSQKQEIFKIWIVNNFIKYPRFYKVPILYQKILRVTFFISIIILTEINSISYMTQDNKLRKPNLQIWLKKIVASIIKSNRVKVERIGKSDMNKKNNKKNIKCLIGQI